MPAAAERTAADPLAAARELLLRLNRTRDARGRRLADLVTYRGFKPWWFHQGDLLLRFLYPYCRHRDELDRVLEGGLDPASAEPEVRELLGRLGLWRPAPRWRGVRLLARLARRLSDAGLLAVSLTALVAARLRRRDTVLMILDSVSPGRRIDFRFHGVYRELETRGYRWLELAHARADYRSTWANLLRRRRLVAFPGLLAKYGSRLSRGGTAARRDAALELEPPGDAEGRFLALVAGWHWRRSLAAGPRVEVYRRLLRLIGARRAIVPDDEQQLFPLTVACRLEGVPTAAFQHGLLNSFHAGLMAYGFGGATPHGPDLMFAWSEYFRERLTRGNLFTRDSCRVSGPIRPPDPDDLAAARASRRSDPQPLRVLLVSELDAPFAGVEPYFEALLDDGEIELGVRLRPGEGRARWLAAAGAGRRQPRFDQSPAVLDAVAGADVVVGCYSSVLYEAIRAYRPVVLLETGFSYGMELAGDGLAELCRQPARLRDAVRHAATTSTATLAARAERIWGAEVRDGAVELFDVAERELWSR